MTNFKKFTLRRIIEPYARKYVGLGSEAELNEFFNPVATTADLANPAATINVTDKYLGKPAYDSTTGLPVWAAGPLVTDAWNGAGAGGGSPLTTVGDLYTYDGADARLPVGVDGFVLTADSGQASGLIWAAAAVGGAVVLNPLTALQTITNTGSTTGGLAIIANSKTSMVPLAISSVSTTATGDMLTLVSTGFGAAVRGMNVQLNGSGTGVNVNHTAVGTQFGFATNRNLAVARDIRVAEQVDHNLTPTATFGQFWVRNDAPNTPMYTDDTGQDFILNLGAVAGGTQPTITGSRGGNAALADLLTNLATIGLIVDGTSA